MANQFRIVDTKDNLVVGRGSNKATLITDAINKYNAVKASITLTIQKLSSSGKFETVGTFQTK